jgi:hypothetical protein
MPALSTIEDSSHTCTWLYARHYELHITAHRYTNRGRISCGGSPSLPLTPPPNPKPGPTSGVNSHTVVKLLIGLELGL